PVPAHQHQDDDEQGDPRPPAPPPAHPRWRSLVPRIVLFLLKPRAGRESRTGRVPLAGLVPLVRRVSLVGLGSLAGREGRPGRRSLARRVLPRCLRVLRVSVLGPLLLLRCLRLLPPLRHGLGGIGAHAALPVLRAATALSPRCLPTIIISPPLRCHLVTG